MAWSIGASQIGTWSIGAAQAPTVTPTVGGIMTTNTGYWGALVILLGLLVLVGVPVGNVAIMTTNIGFWGPTF